MKKILEYAMLDRILFIGNEIPTAVAGDSRPKFVLLGSPQELIDAVAALSPPDHIRNHNGTDAQSTPPTINREDK